jgi:hypothetical protein
MYGANWFATSENQLNQGNLQVEQFTCEYVTAYFLETKSTPVIGKISAKCIYEFKAEIEIWNQNKTGRIAEFRFNVEENHAWKSHMHIFNVSVTTMQSLENISLKVDEDAHQP